MFSQGEATIHYNKLQADPKQGKSLDIGISSSRHILTVVQFVLQRVDHSSFITATCTRCCGVH